MSAPFVLDEILQLLQERFGTPNQVGRSNRLWTFGKSITCSVNYSKLLRGNKFFFGLSQEVADKDFDYPATKLGGFVLLVCGSARDVLVLPRSLVLEMLDGVATRKLDVFREDEAYILQTTQHPKLNVTEFLNAYPKTPEKTRDEDKGVPAPGIDRDHVKYQSALIDAGRAEGCSVWVPPGDRGLSYHKRPFSERTILKLPNFGFDENTRRIVQNIDVLWLSRNVIRKAFEVEVSTTIYSGLLRMNDLVLAQPNNQIELYIAANNARRQKVLNQLIRPSFHSLLSKCEFLAFECIDEAIRRIEGIPVHKGARVTGIVQGERFQLPENWIYPSGV
jgi:hypothetical protein